MRGKNELPADRPRHPYIIVNVYEYAYVYELFWRETVPVHSEAVHVHVHGNET